MLNKNRIFLLLALLVATFALVACGSGGDAEATFTTVTSDSGFTVDLPESWAYEDSAADGFSFANSESVLESVNTDSPGNGAGGNIQLESVDDLGMEDPVELLTLLLSFFTAEGDDLTVVSEATAIEGHPQSAAKATLSGAFEGMSGEITAVVVIGDTDVAVALIVDTTADNEHADVINQIADSIKFE